MKHESPAMTSLAVVQNKTAHFLSKIWNLKKTKKFKPNLRYYMRAQPKDSVYSPGNEDQQRLLCINVYGNSQEQ